MFKGGTKVEREMEEYRRSMGRKILDE